MRYIKTYEDLQDLPSYKLRQINLLFDELLDNIYKYDFVFSFDKKIYTRDRIDIKKKKDYLKVNDLYIGQIAIWKTTIIFRLNKYVNFRNAGVFMPEQVEVVDLGKSEELMEKINLLIKLAKEKEEIEKYNL